MPPYEFSPVSFFLLFFLRKGGTSSFADLNIMPQMLSDDLNLHWTYNIPLIPMSMKLKLIVFTLPWLCVCLTPRNLLLEDYYNFETSAIQLAAFSCHSILYHCAFHWLRLTSKYFHSPLFEAAMGLLTSSTNHFSCLRGARGPMEVWKYDPHHLLLTFVFLGPVSDGPISSDPHRNRRSRPWVGKQEVLLVGTLFFFQFTLTCLLLQIPHNPGREIRNI